MRVWDAEQSVYKGLRALPKGRYLCAMWILCGELMSLYADAMGDAERGLMTSTLDLVREAAVNGWDGEGVVARAKGLMREWDWFTRKHNDEALPGRLNVWAAFEGLATAIAGESAWHYASGWAAKAAAERWRDPYRRRRRFNPDEVADDGSPLAVTLTRFQRVVAGVADLGDGVRDPAEVRSRVLGPDPPLPRPLRQPYRDRSRVLAR